MDNNSLPELLKKYQLVFNKILPFDPQQDRLVRLDFTENNKQLTPGILNDINLFCDYIDQQLFSNKALYGIGGYCEHRTIYSRSRLFDGEAGEEPRRFHLGIDIWGKAYTPIAAPLDAIVHSLGFNNNPGDYGATIILQHTIEDTSFYTLYGHLTLESIDNLKEGDQVRKEQSFTAFGQPSENGHWPPHLHFQVIQDMQHYKGDYPGVCKFSEREKYKANCPDPDIILQMMQFTG
jgi:peptidoglycan LD-endopeptidase LytH